MLWVGPAGQRVNAVDVSRGVVHDIWLPEVALPIGAFAVLDVTANPVRVVDWLDHATVARARRDAVRVATRLRATTARTRRAAAKREEAAAAEVVRAAQELLRRP